jgi:hypothetical protein
LFLQLEQNLFQGLLVQMLHQAAKGRLAGGRIGAVLLAANAQGAALSGAEAAGKEGQVFLAARGAAPMGQQANAHQTPERIEADAAAVIRQPLEVLDPGTDLRGPVSAAGTGLGFDGGQGRLEFVGSQTAAGVAVEFPHEESFGPVVFDVEIAAHAAEALGGAQLLPALGGRDRAAELLRIDEGFD